MPTDEEPKARKLLITNPTSGLVWSAYFDALRISTLSLVVAPAKYCSPDWNQSSHANKQNTPFNEALRTTSVYIKPTLVNFLPLLSGIESIENRGHYTCEKLVRRVNN